VDDDYDEDEDDEDNDDEKMMMKKIMMVKKTKITEVGHWHRGKAGNVLRQAISVQ
jgi:hypothetical protein